jgi:hypothetical protein
MLMQQRILQLQDELLQVSGWGAGPKRTGGIFGTKYE